MSTSGGLRFGEAVARVREKVEAPLHRPLTLTVDTFKTQTTPWDLGYRVDVPAAVRQAMGVRTRGNFVSRVSSQLFSSGGAPYVEIKPAWGPGRLDEVVAAAGKIIGTAPKDADIDVSTGWVKMVPEKAGKEIDVEASKRAVMDGVTLGDATVKMVARPIKAPADPTLSQGHPGAGRREQALPLRERPDRQGVAGRHRRQGLSHPRGRAPHHPEARQPVLAQPRQRLGPGLPAVIGPGPNNPLGTRALRLDAPAILIHATSNRGSIGYSESHGCIRMTEENEAELFGLVGVGTRVAVVQVTPPRAKGAAPIDATAF